MGSRRLHRHPGRRPRLRTLPRYLDIFSPREARDYYTCIEWAGVQPWSNGKVGLRGISYYAVNQWQVAALRPPHLAAICPWEGANDYYREFTHHGGIASNFLSQWYPPQVEAMQHGVGDRGARNPVTGVPVAGPETLDPDLLEKNRADVVAEMLTRPTLDDYYRDRSADLTRITVPTLSATNWGHHLHTRGGFEGYTTIPAEQKWLEVHGQQHWVEFYTDYSLRLQKRFLVLRVQDPNGRDVTFPGATDPHGAIAFGWLRGSPSSTPTNAPVRPLPSAAPPPSSPADGTRRHCCYRSSLRPAQAPADRRAASAGARRRLPF